MVSDLEARTIEQRDDQIVVTLRELHRGEKMTLTGWSPAREDLGLNGGGPDPVDGVELIDEEPVYYPDDDPEDSYPRGHTEVVLGFADEDALEAASDRLYDKATERFEWGASDAEDVQEFAGRLPTPREVDDAE